MEKSRKGVKPIKLPLSLFESWNTLFSLHTITNSKLQPVIDSLQTLLKCQNEGWDKQAAYIKNTGKIFQKIVNTQLERHELDQLLSIIEPIVSLGYFAASENLSRRVFVPMIETIVQLARDKKRLSLRDYYLQYISSDSTEKSFEGKPVSQRALTIYATLKFKIGQEIIVDHYQQTLEYLVHALMDSQNTLRQKEGMNHLRYEQLMNDTEYSLKAVLVLLSRQIDIVPQLFQQVEMKYQNENTALFGRLLQVLLDVCCDTTTFMKECNQVAGMAIGAFINLTSSLEFARDWILGWFFSIDSNSAVDHIRTYLGVSKPNLSENGRDVPLVFILRGLVSSLRREIIILPLPPRTHLVSSLESTHPRNIHDILFQSIDRFCERTELDAACKVIAFESMATWLQQTKDTMEKHIEDMDMISGPVKPAHMHKLVHYVWDHWDDPIDSIQHKVRSIFDYSLSTLKLKSEYYQQQKEYDSFIVSLLNSLIMMDWHRKVKYSLLNILAEKIDSRIFLKTEPQLIGKCLCAMDNHVLSPQITYFIFTFLYKCIRDTVPGYQDFNGHNGRFKPSKDAIVTHAISAWINIWIEPLISCLTSSSETLRKNVSGFILPPLFKMGAQSFWAMMHVLQDVDDKRWETRFDRHYRLHAFIAVLKAARSLDIVDGTTYTRENASMDKISVHTLQLAIHHSDAQVRMDALGLFCESRKATSIVTSIELEMIKSFLPLNMNSTAPEFRQQMCAHLGKLLTRLRGNVYSQYRNYKSLLAYAEKSIGEKRTNALLDAKDCMKVIDQEKSFLNWLCGYTAVSLYPGASYQRVATALRLLTVIVKIFGIDNLPPIEGFTNQQPDFPFKIPIATASISKLLIDTLTNSYDFNRSQAFDILNQFPSPLPGIESEESAQQLLWWGLNNVVSTRASESSSGAMVFRLIFTKYVVKLNYDLKPDSESNGITTADTSDASIIFTERLLNMLEDQVNTAKSNLLLAAQQHPMHGTLLALQYVYQEINYQDPAVQANFKAWRRTITRTIQLIETICDTVMVVLSDPSPEGNVPANQLDEDDHDLLLDDEDETAGPKHQVILSCCWRAVKEASSLLQVIVTEAPPKDLPIALLTSDDLVKSGTLLRTLLTKIRHRGAFSAVYPAYVCLNSKLLKSQDVSLSSLPSLWLQENLDSLTSTNISITRRSAGLPLCILAIVTSDISPKKELLRRTMKHLMKIAIIEPSQGADQKIDLPQVHAYNIMRIIFMDSKLGAHILEYVADGFALAINGFSSFSWAIRNCSVMLFSTLLQRTFGTKKTKDEHSTVNTLTGREFFVRFPDLHPYLLEELKKAIEQLLANSVSVQVHPGLYPILTLLSRMQPSTEDNDTKETVLTPFISLVLPCATSAIYKTREMAARALVPLVIDVVPTVKQLMEIKGSMTQNEIHGQLLQAQFLLRGRFYAESMSKKVLIQFMKEMPDIVTRSFDLLLHDSLCNMNSALFLNILAEFFVDTQWISSGDRDAGLVKELVQLSNIQFNGVRDMVKEFCMRHMDDISSSYIGSYLFREAMANIIILYMLNKPDPDINRLLFLLQDRDYEVRILILQKLTAFYTDTNKSQNKNQRLQTVLVTRIYQEEDHLDCYALTAKLLMNLFPHNPYPVSSQLPFTLNRYWDKLVQQFTEKKSLSVTESILPLMGSLLAQILSSTLDTSWKQQCLITWCRYVEKHSKSDISLPLREAVIKSLQYIAPYIFNDQEDLFVTRTENAHVIVGLTIIQLLQDDDVDIRDNTANMITSSMKLQAPIHHERALELVHRYLVQNQGDSNQLVTSLMSILSSGKNLQTVCKESMSQSKVLFEKENPNIYKEFLIDIQWANVDIEVIQKRHTSYHLNTNLMENSTRELIIFCQLMKDMSRTYMKSGPYGICSTPSVFKSVYSLVLCLRLDFNSLDYQDRINVSPNLSALIKELYHTLTLIKEEWIHPLIWTLLYGEQGLYFECRYFLKCQGELIDSNPMFLLSDDSKSM
ncbi:putative death-receptor fusion protein-domain-containing protein [Pilobolus umbonatus]|nr:putative death-receptor fusion protein-domain-containing protein [Pilobolus umbonatus]